MWTKNNTTEELIQGVIRHGPEILENCICSDDLSKYINRINQERLDYPIPPTEIDSTNWFIPKEYQEMDIEKWVWNHVDQDNEDRVFRVSHELELFKKHEMVPMLKAMKYIVDTLRANNIVWGVGRGSSVASYVLYLIGVHKIDSIKYNLPIEEFFKEI